MIGSDEGLFNPRVCTRLRLARSEGQNPHSYFLKTCHAKRDKVGSKVQSARDKNGADVPMRGSEREVGPGPGLSPGWSRSRLVSALAALVSVLSALVSALAGLSPGWCHHRREATEPEADCSDGPTPPSTACVRACVHDEDTERDEGRVSHGLICPTLPPSNHPSLPPSHRAAGSMNSKSLPAPPMALRLNGQSERLMLCCRPGQWVAGRRAARAPASHERTERISRC